MEQDSQTQPEQTTHAVAPAPSAQTSADADAQKRKLIGVLSYLSILVVVAYVMADKDAKLMFHVKQGVVLFICEVAVMLLVQTILMMLGPLYLIVNLFFLALSIIGIMNVLNGKEKELPLIGQLAVHVPL